MIFEVHDDIPKKVDSVYEFVIPYVLKPELCVKVCFESDSIVVYVPDGSVPEVRNEFIYFFKDYSKGD